MPTPIKKRRIITLDVKKQIIVASATKKLKELSEQFELPVPTIQTILKNKASILSAVDEGGEAKRSHMQAVKQEDLEAAVLQWFKQQRSANNPMSGPLLTEKARELAKELAKPLRTALGARPLTEEQSKSELEKKADELEGFKGSVGWLEKFKHRHSIVFKGNQGEAADIDMEALSNWQQDNLRDAISNFSADDVFNADETGLLWKLLPNKTLAFKGDRCTSGKKSKERITVLVGANMSGSEKLPLLVIGKSAKPRSFKNKEVPVDYKANKKAWMTAALFEEWLKAWDWKLKQEGRKVLLYLDNFSGHSNIKLGQITVKFLPPNTTAASQPCDQGIIQNLKVHYRRFLLRERIAAIDAETDYNPNLLNALQFLRRSWADVKPETIANCFRKAGFIKNVEPSELLPDGMQEVQAVEDDANDELNTLWAELQELELVESVELADYLAVDDQLATGGTLTLAEIAADVSVEPEVESDTDVMEIDEEPEPPVTSRDATAGLKLFQRFVEENFNNPAVLQMCDKLDDFLAKERVKKLKQRNILNYFTANTT